MSIHDVNNFLSLSSRGQEELSDSIVRNLYMAYARCKVEREKNGDTYKGFSRKDYNKYKTDDALSSSVLESTIAPWSTICSLIPGIDVGSRDKFGSSAVSKKRMFKILRKIALSNDISPYNVSRRQFEKYRSESSDNIPEWRSFTRRISNSNEWTKTVQEVCDFGYQEMRG